MKRSNLKRKTLPDPQRQIREAFKEAKRASRFRPNKYGAIKTWESGIKHDSKLEAGHARELRAAEKAGVITDLEFQKDLVLTVNGKQICTYVADFFYFVKGSDCFTVADSKGKRTAVFNLKWKLCQALYPEYQYVLFTKPWIEI